MKDIKSELMNNIIEIMRCDKQTPIKNSEILELVLDTVDTIITNKQDCEHNGYTIIKVCINCGKHLNQEESDRCCNG